jgi:hypothetical protein
MARGTQREKPLTGASHPLFVRIAALAVREGASVLTYDRHFELFRRVGVQLLTAEGSLPG